MTGYEKSPDYGGAPSNGWLTLGGIILFLMVGSLPLLAWMMTGRADAAPPAVHWVDGDSGSIGGEDFRLADVDAPETTPVGPERGARCEAERTKGFAAKAFMTKLTSSGTVKVIPAGETDRYGRRVVSIVVDGQDVAAAGLAAGHLKPWRFEHNRATQSRPTWCP